MKALVCVKKIGKELQRKSPSQFFRGLSIYFLLFFQCQSISLKEFTQKEFISEAEQQTIKTRASRFYKKANAKKAAEVYSVLCDKRRLFRHCYQYAWYLAQAGQWKKSEMLLEDILLSQPKSVQAHRLLGYVFLNQGRPKLSSWHSLQALAISPKDSIALANLAEAYASQGRYGRAAHLLQEAIQIRKHSQKGKFPKERKTYTQARLHYLLARYFAAQRKIKEALQSIQKARVVHPKKADYLCLHAELLFENKSYKKSVLLLRQCRKVLPERNSALLALLGSLMQTGSWGEAYHEAKFLLTMGYKQKALPALLVASLKTKRYKKCNHYALRLRKIRPAYPDLDYMQALCLSHLGRYKSALPFYQKAIQSVPNSKGLYYNTGVALEHLGKTKEALVSYRKGCEQQDRFSCQEERRLHGLLKKRGAQTEDPKE